MKRCPNCGKKISEYSLSCPFCGTDKLNVMDVRPKAHKKNYILHICSLLIIPLAFITISLWATLSNISSYFPAFLSRDREIVNLVEDILENDLNSSVDIIELYYNEQKQGCLVEFTVNDSSDIAAVHLDNKQIDYKSEFNYYSNNTKYVTNEQELHKCNRKILESSYPDWNFDIAVLEANGETSGDGWKKIK